MKSKVFYILLIVCCLSLFSSARQTGRYCYKTASCCQKNAAKTPAASAGTSRESDLDLPPFHLLDI